MLCVPFDGALAFFRQNLVCWRKSKDPQLMERNPQLIPKMSQVVWPIQAYIRRLSHGERYMKRLEV